MCKGQSKGYYPCMHNIINSSLEPHKIGMIIILLLEGKKLIIRERSKLPMDKTQ